MNKQFRQVNIRVHDLYIRIVLSEGMSFVGFFPLYESIYSSKYGAIRILF